MKPHRLSGAFALGLVFAASGALAAPLDSYKAAALAGPYTFESGYTGDLTLWARHPRMKGDLRSRAPRSSAKVESAPLAAPTVQPDLFRFDTPAPATPLAFTLGAAAREKAIEVKADRAVPVSDRK